MAEPRPRGRRPLPAACGTTTSRLTPPLPRCCFARSPVRERTAPATALSNPAEQAAADRLIAARLLEDDDGFLRPTPLAAATLRAAPEPRYLRWTACSVLAPGPCCQRVTDCCHQADQTAVTKMTGHTGLEGL